MGSGASGRAAELDHAEVSTAAVPGSVTDALDALLSALGNAACAMDARPAKLATATKRSVNT